MKLITGNLMNRNMRNAFIYLVLLSVVFVSCNKKTETEKPIETSVPVTITHIDTTAIESFIDLNATTTYLIKNTIKSNATGYIELVNVVSNDYVKNGQVLFSLKTREAKVLGNTINKIDASLNFGKAIVLRATSDGYVNAVNVQKGDYVQDGDPLAVINDAKSFSIVLSLPYELIKYVPINKVLNAFLPDGTIIPTRVEKFMPTVDPASQTQNVILKCVNKQNIPENLIVKIRIDKTVAKKTISLPKSAVLSDETETDFWIMKMINNTTAVRVPIKKGIEAGNKIEILSPNLESGDKILLTGNYGVADTIKVKILNK
jgi:multidrug efflux pump subunit AcrA (membrane-fusion protein)